MTNQANAGRFRRVVVVLATTILVLALAPAVGAAPPGGCEPYPGDTTIRWHSLKPHVSSVEISWFDAEGNVIETVTVSAAGRPFYTQQTPEGTVEFGATFYDEAGNVLGVFGGVCGAT